MHNSQKIIDAASNRSFTVQLHMTQKNEFKMLNFSYRLRWSNFVAQRAKFYWGSVQPFSCMCGGGGGGGGREAYMYSTVLEFLKEIWNMTND